MYIQGDTLFPSRLQSWMMREILKIACISYWAILPWLEEQRKVQPAPSNSLIIILSLIHFHWRKTSHNLLNHFLSVILTPVFRLQWFFYFHHGGDCILHFPELVSRMYLQVCLPEFHHRNHKRNGINIQIYIQKNCFSGFNTWILELSFVLSCWHAQSCLWIRHSSLQAPCFAHPPSKRSLKCFYNWTTPGWDQRPTQDPGNCTLHFPKTVCFSLKTSCELRPGT